MRIKTTLGKYLAKTYFYNFLVLFTALMAVVYLFDTVELLRRASKHEGVSLGLVAQMGLLKLPEVGQILFPFAVLFSAMFTFWQLTKRYELIVVRSAGFSVWQFLAPIITVSIGIGVLQMSVINPVGAVFLGKFEQLESKYLTREDSQIAVFKEGIWLRQGHDLSENGYVILHAQRIEPPWTLKNVTVFYFNENNTFLQRLNAETAELLPGKWSFSNTTLYGSRQNGEKSPTMTLPTKLTISDVEESFSSPETMSFWKLPDHIRTLENTGFDASRLKVHYQNLLAQPLLFAAMILLAATVSMRPPRASGGFMLIGVGVFIGFFVFFMSSFLQALGASGQIPVFLAAWSPALICLLLGVSVTMNLEDG